MSWLLSEVLRQDKKLARAVSKISLPTCLLMARICVMIGAFGEVLAFALTNKEIQGYIEDKQLGYFQSQIMMLTGFYSKHMKDIRKRSYKLFENEFGSDWAEEIFEKLRF